MSRCVLCVDINKFYHLSFINYQMLRHYSFLAYQCFIVRTVYRIFLLIISYANGILLSLIILEYQKSEKFYCKFEILIIKYCKRLNYCTIIEKLSQKLYQKCNSNIYKKFLTYNSINNLRQYYQETAHNCNKLYVIRFILLSILLICT